MKPLSYELPRMFEYDAWANREALSSLRDATSPPEKAVRMMSHVIATLMLWHDRIVQDEARVPVWPEWTIAACEQHLEPALLEWKTLVTDVIDSDLDRVIRYTNSKGETYSSSFKDIAIHVSMHGAYHRGQVAAELSRVGEKPAYTDFIHAARTGVVGE